MFAVSTQICSLSVSGGQCFSADTDPVIRSRPVTETMLRSLLMVCGLMSLNQSSVTISFVRSNDI